MKRISLFFSLIFIASVIFFYGFDGHVYTTTARLAVPPEADAGTPTITGGGTANYLPLFNSTTSIISSILYQLGGNLGIGTTNPQAKLHVSNGGIKAEGMIESTSGGFKFPDGSIQTSSLQSPTGWQTVFTSGATFGCCSWNNVGPSLSMTTNGGPVLITLDLYAVGGVSSHVTCQPVIDGQWAGSYSGMIPAGADPFWKEGLTQLNGGWLQWNKTKIYPGVPSGVHTLRAQCATNTGSVDVCTSSGVGCSIQVIELPKMGS